MEVGWRLGGGWWRLVEVEGRLVGSWLEVGDRLVGGWLEVGWRLVWRVVGGLLGG